MIVWTFVNFIVRNDRKEKLLRILEDKADVSDTTEN